MLNDSYIVLNKDGQLMVTDGGSSSMVNQGMGEDHIHEASEWA